MEQNMPNEKQLNEIVLVFELKNTQNSYARCLSAITYFENQVLNSNTSASEFFTYIKRIPIDDFIFNINQRRNGPNDKMEHPINPDKYARIPVSSSIEEDILVHALKHWREDKENIKRPLYHIRIMFEYDQDTKKYCDIDNLQFLAMFMQQVYKICFGNKNEFNDFIPNKLKERLSVYLVPYTGVSYKFAGDDKEADISLYSHASQYLRLITKMHNGVIYGNSSKNKIEALDFSKRTRNNSFFPLLYLGNSELDNYNKVFEASGMPDFSIIEKSFTYKLTENDSRPFNDAGNGNPHVAIADLLLDETRARLFSFFASIYEYRKNEILPDSKIHEYGRLEIAKYIEEIKFYISNCDRLTFALFGYLLFSENKDKVTIQNAIKETFGLARELGDGIRQIVQNSLQHSQYQACFISLSKVEIHNSNNKAEQHLSIRVTDINTQKTIIETFIDTLKAENKFDIFNIANIKLSVNQLISEFDSEDDDVLTAWCNYRSRDTSAHIGLTLFKNTLKRCKCRLLQIISNTAFKLEPMNMLLNNFDDKKNEILSLPAHVIPGTQVYFLIPIKEIQNSSPVNLVQLGNNDAFREDYTSFAYYLDYKITDKLQKESIKLLNDTLLFSKNIEITNAMSKYNMQQNWKTFWQKLLVLSSDTKYNENIHLFDLLKIDVFMKYLNEKDNCEIFIKGFFAATSTFFKEGYQEDSDNYYICFYFKNLPIHFIQIFQEVGSSLSLMNFSRNLQVFFTCNDDKDSSYSYKQSGQLVALGNKVGHVIQNAYIMSLEHGEKNINTAYYIRASELLKAFNKIQNNQTTNPQLVCPFNVFEDPSCNDKLPKYFKQIKEIVEQPLVNRDISNRGYCLTDIHMRLGNKVHADSFYEMSFLFYRTSVANRVAFYILQDILEVLLKKSKDIIVFYGYASYSQALIFSLQEILRKYLIKKGIVKDVHYAVHQYNLQLESFLLQYAFPLDNSTLKNTTIDRVQIYSTLELSNNGPYKTSVVQIVPIGSTLTTFDKMRAKYNRDRDKKGIEISEILINYNVFLIRDKNEKIDNGRSHIEMQLWDAIDTNEKKVKINNERLTELVQNPYIFYIIDRASFWQQPIKCKQCFPDIVNEEVPLVETDPTSTVPTLQIYQNEGFLETNNNLFLSAENIKRLFELQYCIYYGHFLRGKNHYQYYIDTQKYISKKIVKMQLIEWLTTEKEKSIKDIGEHFSSTPVLNIIFSPEHNSNVGFSQYVNTYYFNGTAEIVSVNVDKQFRSNFVCEHDALRKIINHLLNEHEGKPINFFFVDDCIITGSSFHRAKMLIQSLIPEIYRKDKYKSIFSKCFVLIDRLSLDTKESYINDPKNNFLSFCKINISNMRKQGDSCVGCKLEYEAKYLFKRSSTRSFANYWAKKALEYTPIMYDDIERRKEYGKEKAFVRMLLTHFIESYLDKKELKYNDIADLFRLIFDRLNKIDSDNNIDYESKLSIVVISYNILKSTKQYTNEQITVCLIEHIIKILSRPFKSYSFNVKRVVLKFIINICESLFSGKSEDDITEKICSIVIAANNNEIKTLDFIKNCLFETLADMRSTYFLRKETIKKVYKFTMKFFNLNSKDGCDYYKDKCCKRFTSNFRDEIKYQCDNNLVRCFWRNYSFHIHKIIDSGGDETRSLWLERLLITGVEFQNDKLEKDASIIIGDLLPLYNSIVINNTLNIEYNKLFKEFCIEVFLQNSRLLFDGIEKIDNKIPETDPSDNSYFLQNMTNLRNWDLVWASAKTEYDYCNEEQGKERGNFEQENKRRDIEKELFDYFMKFGNEEKKIKEKYKNFVQKINNMIVTKYSLEENTLRIVLLTQNGSDESIDMNNLDFITENTPENYSKPRIAKAKYIIKKRIIWAVRSNPLIKVPEQYYETRLIDDGYCLMLASENNELNKEEEFDFDNDSTSYRKPFFILRFDNIQISDEIKLDREAKPIEKVYLYISFKFNQSGKVKTVPILIMRDILSYRNRIMRMLEKDFNSQLMQAWARETGENTVLKHEKAVDHSTNLDDLLSHRIWGTNKQLNKTDFEWLLFRNNTNIQIAKLFNRLLLDSSKSHKQIPKLYLHKDDINNDNTYSMPAKNFLLDLWDISTDKRVQLCKDIISFTEINLENAIILFKDTDEGIIYFNLEYLKCIFYDIFLSCAKFWNEDADFLSRVKKLIRYKKEFEEIEKNCDPDYQDLKIAYDDLRCKVILLRENCNLVIINPVRREDNKIFDGWDNRTKQIRFQLENPYDSFNGNMSLYTINNYIKGISGEESLFKYILFKDLQDKWKEIMKSKWKISNIENESLWFISILPIFKE